ncbi:hypothetical protein CK203_027384 [Vitis vinifera]|uniref:DUF4283 domain-containing protein n=1 Tax=Vitis vinifera TaxID=29760 RepID=A0A438J9U5_VITVI|nr:hypothetical protein CK203_027384 [Vitis vinifera]
MKCKVERIIVEKKSFQVEFEGLNGGTWVSVTERSRGFIVSVGFDMEELDWLMEHFKKVVEGVKERWEDLRKAILSVQEYSKRDGGASKEKNGDIRMNRDTFRGGRSYAEVVAEVGFRTGGKFRRGWLVLKGLPFHLWDEVQLNFILKKWGRVTKVAKETLKLVDLTRAKLWVEMLPNVVLPALLEVEDGEWSYTVAVSVTGEDDKADVSRRDKP